MKILLTGGSGFLGSEVIPRLRGAGHDVIALARSTPAARRVESLGAEALPGDLDDVVSVDQAFLSAGADVLINLASLGFGHAPAIVAAAEEAGIARAVFISTTAIFTTLPARSRTLRVAAEDAIRISALQWTIIRPTMIYGAPGDRNMIRLLRFLRKSPLVPIPGGGQHLLQPVHVADLSCFIATVVSKDETVGAAYDVAGPEPMRLREMIEIAGSALGRRPRLVPAPLGPAIAAARVYERLARNPRLRPEQIMRLNEDKVYDIGPARALGYHPISFNVGISREAAMLP